MEKRLAYLAIALVFAAGLFVGLSIRRPRPGTDVPEPQRDTTWIHDTIRIAAPAPKTIRVRDTVLLAIHDTLILHRSDTAYVPVPLTESTYSGEGWQVWITGYHATLDSLHLDRTTGIVEVPVYKTVTKHTRWGVGIQAGATYLPNQGVIPYVGLGISYNLLTF